MNKLSLRPIRQLYKSSLLRAAGTYGVFSTINSSIPFLLLPILTRYLSPSDYGIVAVFNILVTITIPFIGLNTNGAFSRAFFAHDRFETSTYTGTIVMFVLLNSLFVTFLIVVFRNSLEKIFSIPSNWLWLTGLMGLSISLIQIALTAWRVRERPKAFGLFQISNTIADFSLAVLLVVVLGMSWQGRIVSRAIIAPIFAFLGIFILKRNKWLTFRWDTSCLCHALAFGIPLIPHSLAGIINTATDRLFIAHMVGVADVGVYTVGYQIGAIINLLATAFNQAYSPWLFKKLNQNNGQIKRKIVRYTYVYFLLILFFAFLLGIVAPFILKYLLGKEFQGSAIYVTWIAVGSAFNGMYYMVVNYIFYAEKTYLLAIVTFTGAAINICMNYFLIKINGAIGAAQATTLVNLITFLFVWVLSARVYSMPWFDFKKTNRRQDKT